MPRTVLDPTDLRKNKLYVRIYLIWTNLFVQVSDVPITLMDKIVCIEVA